MAFTVTNHKLGGGKVIHRESQVINLLGPRTVKDPKVDAVPNIYPSNNN